MKCLELRSGCLIVCQGDAGWLPLLSETLSYIGYNNGISAPHAAINNASQIPKGSNFAHYP